MPQSTEPNWARLQRYRLVDLMVGEFGYCARRVLMDYFGVSSAQAAQDLKAYAEKNPSGCRYDTKTQAYVRTESFKRRFQ